MSERRSQVPEVLEKANRYIKVKIMSKYLAGKRPSAKDLNTWINFFHANGFLVIPNVLKPEQCQRLRSDLESAIKKTQGEDYHLL
ncbi:MAG: hypothetical protein AAFR37_03110 [Cyanobacteria bacterium J06628_3]